MLAVTDDHRALSDVARAFLDRAGARGEARAALGSAASVPACWSELAALGWLGLHVPAADGGEGFGVPELAVVVEALGHAVLPGPFLPTAITAGVVSRAGSDDLRRRLLPGIVAGTATAAVGLRADGFVVGGADADLVLLVDGDDTVLVEDPTIAPLDSLDPGRPVGRLDLGTGVRHVLGDAGSRGVALARTLVAAEAAGGARACLEQATGYAKERVQFGRVIGSFQAVKHHCADMLVDVELASAVAWEAARVAEAGDEEAALAAAVAVSIAVPAYLRCAQMNIQLHGGIGFTWEHDAHLHLRRAAALQAFVGGPERPRQEIVAATRAGTDLRHRLDLPDDVDGLRAAARAVADEVRDLPDDERRRRLASSGYLVPHWPRPWGLAATAVEQLLIEEELAGVERPRLGISAWIVLTLIQHATDGQRDRWVRSTLDGDVSWCQLFSEPNAGSDAANIQTRGVRTDGGWLVTGQKVWTSGAQRVELGLATVRTDSTGPKHSGVTAMVIEMKGPGVEVRPLRDITGNERFNEVFLEDAFVPDSHVVGTVGDGWRVARSTLGNERVSIGSDRTAPTAIEAQLPALLDHHAPGDVGFAREVGALVADRHAIQVLALRQAARAVAGQEPGAEGNVLKLLVAEHEQRVSELAIRLVGSEAGTMAVVPGADTGAAHNLLYTRGLTIAGGTAEIVRNQIAERILGLPREPS